MCLLTVTAVLFGCGVFNEKYEYTEEYARVLNIGGSAWLVDKNLDVTTVNENTYRFDKGITEKERVDFIKNHQKICSLLIENGISAKGLDCFVLSGIESRAVAEENAVYIDNGENKSIWQVCLTVQAILGEYTNYGYVYALSNHIADELGWQKADVGEVDEAIFNNAPELLNLVYPCFTEDYYDAEEIAACHALAVNTFNSMQDCYGGETEFAELICEYAESIGVDFTPTYLKFAFGGDFCPLKIRTKYLDMYLCSDYEGSCTFTQQAIEDDPMFNFDSMIEFLSFADDDLSQVREKLNFTSEDTIPVYVRDIYTLLTGGAEIGGMFFPSENGPYIEMAEIYTITHEYVHYIDFNMDTDYSDDEDWCGEVLACYYGANMSYVSRVVVSNSGDEEVWTVDLLSDLIGEAYDGAEDEIMVQNILTAYHENPRYALISDYDGRMSFGDYFVKTYGEEMFVECMYDIAKTQLLLGVEIDEIIDDWCVWLEQFKVLGEI